jgi:predicted MPP superfamily phosphohydrolase
VNWKLVDYHYGKALIRRLVSDFPEIPVIVTTGYPAGPWPEAYKKLGKRIDRLQKRYRNVRKVVMKGSSGESSPEFVDELLDEVERLLGTCPDHNTAPVSWFHLSDLHLKDKSYEQDKVLKQLLDDIELEIKEERWKPDFIVVTGDIAFSAQSEQYKRVGTFFDKLLRITGLSKHSLFVVPGNHDVDWDKLDKYLTTTFNKPEEVTDFLSDPKAQKARISVFSKFHNYAKFVNTYFVDEDGKPIRPFDEEHYFYVASQDFEAGKTAILGLNSAWASALRFDFDKKAADDEKHLLLGEPQVDKALKLVEKCHADTIIALVHHPFEWLAPFDRKWVEHPLREKCHFIFHGHLHETVMGNHIAPTSEVFVLGAGTTYEKRDHRNCYCYVSLDLATGKGLAHLRRYSPEHGGGWVPDTISYPAAKSDKVPFTITKKT